MVYDLTRVAPPLFVELSVSEQMLKPKVYNEGFEYTWITFDELHKVTARFSYAQAMFKDGYRRKENVIKMGNLLAFDIDQNLRIGDVLAMVEGVKSMIVTTMSHTNEHHRFRLIVAADKTLDRPVHYYKELQECVLDFLGIERSAVDEKCLGDIARQYAPNPEQEHFYVDGDPVPMGVLLEEAQRRCEVKKKPSLVSPPPMPEYHGESVIEAFNRDNCIEAMLDRYGFKKKGDKWLSPNSSSGLPGVVILEGDDGKRRAWSHHASDGWQRALDAFDFYVFYEHHGDIQSAVQSLKGAA